MVESDKGVLFYWLILVEIAIFSKESKFCIPSFGWISYCKICFGWERKHRELLLGMLRNNLTIFWPLESRFIHQQIVCYRQSWCDRSNICFLWIIWRPRFLVVVLRSPQISPLCHLRITSFWCPMFCIYLDISSRVLGRLGHQKQKVYGCRRWFLVDDMFLWKENEWHWWSFTSKLRNFSCDGGDGQTKQETRELVLFSRDDVMHKTLPRHFTDLMRVTLPKMRFRWNSNWRSLRQ